MKKVIRITESDLTNIIRRVIKEQQGEDKTQQCQKIKNRIAKNTRRGERLLKLFPKPFQPIMKKAFEEGKKNGPDAFFTALPNEIRDEVKNRFSKLKKPKTDAELEKMVVDIESKQSNIQEQQPGPIWFEYAFLIFSLGFMVYIIWGLSRPAEEYCGQSIWW